MRSGSCGVRGGPRTAVMSEEPRGGPSLGHEKRRELLETVATAAGYLDRVPAVFRCGLRPDVWRLRRESRVVFIGEAKETERPTCKETRERLMAYVAWLLKARPRVAVLAVCFGREEDAEGWGEVLHTLTSKISEETTLTYRSIDPETHLAWIYVGM